MGSSAKFRVRHRKGSDTYYVELRHHPHKSMPGIAKRTVSLHDLIDNYDGPSLFLDIDQHGQPIGIEVLYFRSDDPVA